MNSARLLERCAEHLKNGIRDAADEGLLRQWNARIEPRVSALASRLLAMPPRQWDAAIQSHAAHHHPWYDFVRDRIGTDDMAAFLLENRYYPAFLTLLQKIRDVQVCEDGARAVEENIADEHLPEPHVDLTRAMMTAVKARARPDLSLALYPSLIDRTLIFYYGYFCDPWHLVGSVFATERLGTHRIVCMGEALRRMGLNERELMFITVHQACDEHHAGDWLERVIVPSIALEPGLAAAVAIGIAACLETSTAYLEFLLQRVIAGDTAPVAVAARTAASEDA
jgi:hypothetical protein